MQQEKLRATEVGIEAPFGWFIGGAIGGVVGSAIFGAVLWFANPDIIHEVIPAVYGLEAGTAGWVFHLGHGLVLGIIFGFIISRETILGAIADEFDTEFIDAIGLGNRIGLVGVTFGLAIWAVLPLAIAIAGAIGIVDDPEFPFAAVYSLFGHMLYGGLLGLLFALIVKIAPAAEAARSPFD